MPHRNVCVDTNGGGLWKYDEEGRRYFRLQEDGTMSAVIEGRFLPDPTELWERRCMMYKVHPEDEMGQMIKPQPATFALWQHWKGVENAIADA